MASRHHDDRRRRNLRKTAAPHFGSGGGAPRPSRMEGRLRWVQHGYGGYTLSYQTRPGRRQMSSNHGAECNRGNLPFILTSARVSTTARGAAHRRKWLISTPNHAPRCSIHPPPHSAAHLRRRRSEVRPGCRESADEWRGVWSWPAPRVKPGVLLDIGAVPEQA